MKQNEFGVYKTVPITSRTMNCTSLTLWITNQRNSTGVCAPGGIWTAVSGSRGPSGHDAIGALGQYTPNDGSGDYMEEERGGGGGSPKKRKYKHKKRRKQKTKRRRERKTKRKRRGKKRKTRIKRKARIKKKTRRRR